MNAYYPKQKIRTNIISLFNINIKFKNQKPEKINQIKYFQSKSIQKKNLKKTKHYSKIHTKLLIPFTLKNTFLKIWPANFGRTDMDQRLSLGRAGNES